MRKRIMFCAAAIVLTVIGFACPAFASDNPVTANASVNPSLTVSGFSPTITFPAGNDGDTVTAANAEQYTVSTNNSKGALVTLKTDSGQMADGVASIQNTNLSITETGANPGTIPLGPLTPINNTITLFNSTSPVNDTFTENWNLSIPPAQPASTYSEQFEYMVIANS